ncbi:actinia tenebrosa protease inhibitors-like isoform X2 [Mercenaria mercenaria]|uniref:actinia tenebrosa protease inhibitors-like isoform X2 n=1 Tax=Mercenaria mercenaria TaxID=6596 RepID=UPI00234EF535|nr:actinia tenebrosa protease inhibitors-like isoform X2 [Mercenaria mercenaria]
MLILFGLIFMLTASLSTSHDINCLTVQCDLPVCKYGTYTPIGACCPVCNPKKPGTCPKPTGFGICVQACSSDNDCPDRQKCCSNGCGKTCQIPTPDICHGICGGIAGFRCPVGHTCNFTGDFPDASGICCKNEPEPDPKPLKDCLQPKKSGPCLKTTPRYFYNTDTCQCESFFWGGCHPNENNFLSLAHCKASCEIPMKYNPACEDPRFPGPCKARMSRWFYNTTSCKCEGFFYGGCDANANNFLNKEWCETNCKCLDVCNLPIKPHGDGDIMCLAYIQSYGYNSTSGKCEKFIYSGCGGNANRFETLEKCKQRCEYTECGTQPLCVKPADPGPCKEFVKRYFYDASDCKCKMFRYGGCYGNSNNFPSKEMCKKSCGSTCPLCSKPINVGSCKTAEKRFYYDSITNKCKPFRGCQPNGNNFRKKRPCNKLCKKPVCSLPAFTGTCKAAIKRYYYDAITGKCHTFFWGGCNSNGNNFRTLKACARKCMK